MRRLVALLLLIASLIPLTALSSSANETDSADLSIIFTHDLHSHIDSFSYNGKIVGGFARIKSVIDDITASSKNTLVLDAGDFSMGTLYQSVFQTAASEYRLMSALGYDAITLGNHEFDYGFDSLKKMINSAKSYSTTLPPILSSNINLKESNLTEGDINDINIKDYTIIKKGNFTFAIFGLIGKDAAELSTAAGIVFEDFIGSAKDTVSEIKNLYSPDLIICLSHGGTGNSVNDEDVELAKAVPDIDVIISGHTHTYLDTPIIEGDTIIASCGEYGKSIGKMSIDINDNKAKLLSYSLIEIDETIPEDANVLALIEQFKNDISNYLSKFGYSSPDEIVAYSPFDFPEQESMSDSLSEQQLGNIISDSYIHSIKNAEGDKYIPIDVAVAPAGVIRASIDKGDIAVSQVFEISSLGIGADGVAGYPLCSVYLYGHELYALAEVDASVSRIMPYAQLYCSGLNYSINTNRMFLNRVYDCWLTDENGSRVEIEDDKLYRVVSGMNSAIMLGTVKNKSFGLLELTPKDANGNEITDFNQHIVHDINGAEIKEWKALADYLSSFPKDTRNISVIPERYASTEGRKNVNTNLSFQEVFCNWNKISWIVCIAVIILVSVIVLIAISIIKKRRKKKRASLLRSEEN